MSATSHRYVPPSGRRSAKSRTGCSFCKKRRIKCDEESPSCGPCLKKGLRCPGLLRLMQWSQKHEVIMHRNMRKASSSEGSTALPPKSLAPTNETARKPAEPDSSEPNHDIQRNKEFNLSHMEDLPVFWNISKPSSSLPQNLCPSPPTQFETQESILSDYYFSVVCPINSCFDSICNPLRSYVGAIMYTCPLIFQCVMAMAAAHLFQKRTEMVNVVLEHRKAAIYILRSEIEMQTSRTTKVVSLLGSILLGMTCSWHNASSVDLVHLETARILFKEYAAEPHGIGSNNLNDRDPGNQIEFVVGAMAYWEAMASFLFDQRLEDLNYLLLSCDRRDEQFIRPNPWSGISDRLFIYMAQAGALSRQKVLTNKISRYISAAARDEIMSKQHQEASELVQRLMHFKPPNRHYIQDPGDKRTPLAHLLRLAHIYKLSILLQLYVSFPNLVATDGKDLVGEEIPNARQQHSDEPRHNLIITLAITILNIMATIPEDSRINAFLTLPLIIAGSVLQPCRTASDYHNSETIYSAPDLVSTIDQEIRLTNMTDCMIDHWRSVVRNRLEIMHSFVALDPIARARQLLELVWIKADIASYNGQWMGSGLSGMTHWMEVMIEERLESIFG